MKVREIMTADVHFCHSTNNLAEAAAHLWDNDCGILPVKDESGKLVGMISDRDICIATVTKNRLASEITVGEVSSNHEVHACAPNDDVQEALKLMQNHQVRRVPVVDNNGELCGILSINDVILAAEAGGWGQGVSFQDAMATLKAICEHRTNKEEDTPQISARAGI
jgi:CBS domain-containing protein